MQADIAKTWATVIQVSDVEIPVPERAAETKAMPGENQNESWMMVVGVIGIVGLLVASLGYALRDSGTYYEAERINQFVLDQQSKTAENLR